MSCISKRIFALTLTACLAGVHAQGRPPYVPPPPAGTVAAEAPRDSAELEPQSGPADPDIEVSGAPERGETCEVSLAASPAAHGPIAISWVDFRNGTRCAFATSQDGGTTWGKPFYVGPVAGGFTGDAVVGVDAKGDFYGACQDYGSSQILFSNSLDGGATWAPWKQVQASPDKPWINGAREGTVFLTWLGSPGGYRRSVDAGKTWEPVISLGSLNHGTSISCGSSGYLHMFFNYGQPLRYVRSRNWGATLEAGRNIVGDMGVSCYGCVPRQHPVVGGAADPGGKVAAAVWSATLPGGDGNDDVWAVISRDSGATWTAPLRANDNANASRQFQPWVAVDKYGRVHAVWTDMRGGKNSIYYANTLGSRFGPNTEITDQRGTVGGFYGDYKGAAIQGDDVLVAWADSRNGDNDVYFSRGLGLAGPDATALKPRATARPRWITRGLYDARGARLGRESARAVPAFQKR